jgi:hypothetical protein
MINTDRKFLIFNVSELSIINFNEVLQTSIDTTRKSVNQTKTLIKWEGNTPTCVENLTTSEGPYTYNEVLIILNTSEWTSPMAPML